MTVTPETERLLKDAGKRYRDATFASWQVGSDKWSSLRTQARAGVIDWLKNRVRTGANLVLLGTVGTGKDHLAVAAARVIADRGFSARYVSALDLIESYYRARREGQEQIALGLRHCRVLIISDPLPNGFTPSVEDCAILMRLVDERYRRKLPTIVTCNAKDQDDLRASLGGPLSDRLLGSASVIMMRWVSHRAGN